MRDTADSLERARWLHLARSRYVINCDKIRRAFENAREMPKTRGTGECFAIFLEYYQMSGVFYYSVIHCSGFFICFMIQILNAQKKIKDAFSLFCTLIKHECLTN